MATRGILRFFVFFSVFFVALLFGPPGWTHDKTKSLGSPSGHVQTRESVPKRIVSMGPNITEIVFALGRGDRLVAVTDFCMYPLEAAALPRVGGYLNPNLENETIYSGIQDLGKALGAAEKAEDLCDTIREALDTVRAKTVASPTTKVFLSLGRAMGSMANLYTVGGKSFLSQLLEIAGGENIFADVDQPYPEASKESLIKRAPDVILEMRPGESITHTKRNQIAAEWNVFTGIPAVNNHRIYVLTEDFLLVPGPRIVKIARAFAQTLHGDL
jgi:iron complex transport system substrate-binding protein